MSREIDERIVAMYFDNKNFESGAQQTLKTLEQLKQSCNMEGVGKGFEALGDISKSMKLDKISQGANKVKSSLRSVGDIVKKAFSLTPIDNFYHGLMNFKSRYFDRVLGFDIAQKLASSLENVFRNLTIAPVSAGWQQYENTMDSIKTIMSSTGEGIDVVKGKLQEMTDYANLTIYSLNDMTSNLGKFTNNGVKLDDATNAMIGLANATADAGQGAQQASMAMYNVSQAIGVGKMTTIDWKSLENANIATQRLKNTFIQSALASGTLEKKIEKVKDATTGLMTEEVQYWTKAEKGSKAEQVTVENFRETLNKGWLTKEAMLKTFAIYSGQMSVDAIAAMGFSKQQAEEMAAIGEAALKAAQEVRTFSKMMDALKESVQSTWATSFEFLFGDMQEGTNLWTRLNDKIDGVLTKGAEARNGILMSWRGMMKDENGQVRKIKDIYDYRKQILQRDVEAGYITSETYALRMNELEKSLGNPELWVDYRDIAIDSFMDMLDVFITVGSTIKSAWTDVFGSFTGDSLKDITKGFRDFINTIREWLGSAEDADSRLSKLKKGLTGVFNVIKIGVNIIRSVIEVGWSVVKPFIDPLLNLFAKFGEWMNLNEANNLGDIIRKLGDRFKGLWQTLANLGWDGAFAKLGDWLTGIWTNIKSGISQWLDDNGLEGVKDWFNNIRAKIEEGVQAVRDWWNSPDNGISNFFKSIYDTVTGWFKSGVDERGFETRSPIAQFFYRIRGDIEGAYQSVKDWWESPDNKVTGFFRSIYDSVTGLFQAKVDDKGFAIRSPIEQFFFRIKMGIEDAYSQVSEWWNKEGGPRAFFEELWASIVGNFTAGENGEPSPFANFFINIKNWFEEAWNSASESISSWWNQEGGPSEFFTNLWTSVVANFTAGENGEASPFAQFFINVWHWFEEAWNNASKSISDWWNAAGGPGEFFKNLWTSVVANFTAGENGEASPFSKFFINIWTWLQEAWNSASGELSKWWEAKDGPKQFFENIWQVVSEQFTPGENGQDAPIVAFFKNLKTDLETVWGEISGWEGWKEIGKFFSDIWGWISEKVASIGGQTNGDAIADSMGIISEGAMAGVESVESMDVSESDVDLATKKVGLLQSIISSITGLIDSAKSWITDSGTGDVAIRFFNTISMVIEAIAIVIEHLVALVNHAVTGKLSGGELAEIIGIVVGFLSLKVFETWQTSKLSKISENATGIGTTMLQMAGAIALISAAVAVIGKMNIADIGKGVGAVVVIARVLGSLVKKLSALQTAKNLGGNEPVKAWERVVGKLITGVAMVGMMTVLINGLPTVIDVLSKAKKYSGLNGDDLMKTMIGMMTAISGLMIGFAVVQKIAPTGLNPKATGMTLLSVLEVIGGIIAGLFASGGIMELAEGIFGDQAIKDVMKGAADLFEGLGNVFNSFFRGIFGLETDEQKLEAGTESLEYLAKFSEGFTLEKTSGIARIIALITDLTKASKGINTDDLSSFAAAAENMAQGMLRFNWVVDGIEGLEGVGRAGSERYQAISEAADLMRHMFESFEPLSSFKSSGGQSMFSNAIDQFINFSSDQTRIEAFVTGLNSVIDSMAGLHDGSNVNFDGIDIVKKLYDSIQVAFDNPTEDLPEFNATPVVDAILSALNVADPAITSAIHLMIQNGLNGLSMEGGNFDTSGIEGLSSFIETMEGLSQPEGLNTDNFFIDTTQIEQNINGMINTLNTEDWSLDKLNLPIDFDVIGDVDEEGKPMILSQIQTQLDDFQTRIESGEFDTQFEIKVRPVLVTEGFDTQLTNLSQNMPLMLAASVNLSDQVLNINDSNILMELRAIKGEIITASTALQRVLYSVDGSVGAKINGVISAIHGININVKPGLSLQEIDNGLYSSAKNSSLTGVSTYERPKPIAIADI